MFVKIKGFFPTKTPYNFKYSLAPDDKKIPGVSLFPNTIGLSIDPVDKITSFALIYQSRCLGVYLDLLFKWSPVLSNMATML